MNMQQLQVCFANSRALNQMKADIALFVNMFVKPFAGDILSKVKIDEMRGFWKVLSVVVEGKYSVELHVGNGRDGFITVSSYPNVEAKSYFHCPFDQDLSLPAVQPIWLALPQMFDKLVEVSPEIQSRADFYSNIAK